MENEEKKVTAQNEHEIPLAEILQKAREAYEQEKANLGHVNIIVAGKTGVGKSTLINAAFRDNLAETGSGRRVTEHLRLIEKAGMPISIYDTVGFELDSKLNDQSANEIKNKIQEQLDTCDESKFIHCLWYCVASTSDRFEEEEQNFVKEMARRLPVIIVLTKSGFIGQAKKLKSYIDNLNLSVNNVCIVLAQDIDDECDGAVVQHIPAFGVNNLLSITSALLPEGVQQAFANVAADVKLKRAQAEKIVKQTVGGSALTGAAPIPGSDAPLLIAAEVAMLARINVLYGVDISSNMLKSIAVPLLGIGGATMAGRAVVSNLLKMFPGLGTLAGGIISAVTAATLTYALGYTYIEIMEQIALGKISAEDLKLPEIQEKMRKIMRQKTEENK